MLEFGSFAVGIVPDLGQLISNVAANVWQKRIVGADPLNQLEVVVDNLVLGNGGVPLLHEIVDILDGSGPHNAREALVMIIMEAVRIGVRLFADRVLDMMHLGVEVGFASVGHELALEGPVEVADVLGVAKHGVALEGGSIVGRANLSPGSPGQFLLVLKGILVVRIFTVWHFESPSYERIRVLVLLGRVVPYLHLVSGLWLLDHRLGEVLRHSLSELVHKLVGFCLGKHVHELLRLRLGELVLELPFGLCLLLLHILLLCRRGLVFLRFLFLHIGVVELSLRILLAFFYLF